MLRRSEIKIKKHINHWLTSRFTALVALADELCIKTKGEKPAIGILLCLTRNDELVELTLPENANIHASEYQLYIPDKEALKKQLEEAQAEWEATRENSSVIQNQGGKA